VADICLSVQVAYFAAALVTQKRVHWKTNQVNGFAYWILKKQYLTI